MYVFIFIIFLLISVYVYFTKRCKPVNQSIVSIKPKVYKKFLVFTSAGNNATINKWFGENRDYDIAISWYGSDLNKRKYLKRNSDIFMDRKDGKFPNFKYLYNNNEFVRNYEAVWICDDDINLEVDKVNRLFEIIKEYDLYILSPSFDPNGKISWKSTIKQNDSFMRYTNFIEMTCPVFSKEALRIIIPNFPDKLKGWGTDWYYMNLLDHKNTNKFAILDEFSVYNPKDNEKKNGIREITKLQSNEDRKNTWYAIRKELNLSEYKINDMYSKVKSIYNKKLK
jgi:hypothetical protein